MSWKSSLTILALAAFATTARAATILPGTPCDDFVTAPAAGCPSVTPNNLRGQAIFDLLSDPGDTNLGIFVVPGDVVVFESPNGSLSDPTTWSDVVRFQNLPGVLGSTATIFADGENGVILPPGFALSQNAVSVLELQVGTGNDALDITFYGAGSATYQIHSDAAAPEIPDPEVPEPSSLLLLASGLGACLWGSQSWRRAG